MGSIDCEQNKYPQALDKFLNALKIEQMIGDRSGEAATFHALGILAAEQEKLEEGVRFMLICCLVHNSIGHRQTKKVFEDLSQLVSILKYTEKQLDDIFNETKESYQLDRGWTLIEMTFEGS